MWRSSSVPIAQKDLSPSRSGGSSNERSHGSGGAGVSPKIERISIARRSHFCASLQSGSCSENYAIRHDLSGQTLKTFLVINRPPFVCQGKMLLEFPARPELRHVDATTRKMIGERVTYLGFAV